MTRFLLLVNPAAGRGRCRRWLARLEAPLAQRGVEVAICEDVAGLRARAGQARREGRDRLLVAGGDGTVHQVLQELAGGDCALAILPAGSGNDLAAALGVPAAGVAALDLALTGRPTRVDLGQVAGRWFGGIAGVGFDGEVAERAGRIRWQGGAALYVWSVLRRLPSFLPPRMRIEHDDGLFEGRAMLAAVANAPTYGGGMRIAPQARIDDRELDLVVVEEVSKLELLRVFPRVYSGRHLPHPKIRTARARRVRVTTDRPMTLYGDGEPLASTGESPVEVEIAPAALAVIRGAG